MSVFNTYKNSGIYDLWKIEKDVFNSLLLDESDDIEILKVEIEHGIAVVKIQDEIASLLLIAVSKEAQEKGIGTRILSQVFKECRKRECKEIYAGHRIGKYLWPGVPTEPNTLVFFKKIGFESRMYKTSEDLVLNVEKFVTDQSIYNRLETEGFQITHPTTSDEEVILKLISEEFPFWYTYYKHQLKISDHDKLLICTNQSGEIVGVTMLFLGGYKFQPMFDGMVGGGRCLGVSEKYRGKGIGLALKAKGTEIARDSGAKYVVVQYTTVPDFYKTLGFQSWRQYHMLVKYL